jgi:tetratricopeptide (TPR) repeat protein
VPLVAATRSSLGRAHFESKQWDAAKPHFDEALRLFHQIGDKKSYAVALFHLGKLNLAAGQDMLRSAATIFHELGDTPSEHAALDLLPSSPALVDKPQKKQA